MRPSGGGRPHGHPAQPRGQGDPRPRVRRGSPGTPARSSSLGAGAPGVEELRGLIGERIAGVPELTRKLGGTEEEPLWVPDEDFDVAAPRPGLGELGPAPDREAELDEIARLFEQRLDRDRPLWAIDVVPRAGGGTVLVWRIHHALADGTAAMRFAEGAALGRRLRRRRSGIAARRERLAHGAGRASRPRAPPRPPRRVHRARVRGVAAPLARSTGKIGTRRRIAVAEVSARRRSTTPPRSSPVRRSTTRCWRSSPARCGAGSSATTDRSATSAPGSRSASTARATTPATATRSSRSGCRSASPGPGRAAAGRQRRDDGPQGGARRRADRAHRRRARPALGEARGVRRADREQPARVRRQRLERPRPAPPGQRPRRPRRGPPLDRRDRASPRPADLGRLARRPPLLRLQRRPGPRPRRRVDGRGRRARGGRADRPPA